MRFITTTGAASMLASMFTKTMSENYRARSTGNQSSGALHSMALARGFAICPDDVSSVPAGSDIDVEILEWPDDDLLSDDADH